MLPDSLQRRLEYIQIQLLPGLGVVHRNCYQDVHQLDPLERPKCKSIMRILSFLHDDQKIKKIIKSQGILDYTAPPPIPDPPLKNEIFFDDIPDYDL